MLRVFCPDCKFIKKSVTNRAIRWPKRRQTASLFALFLRHLQNAVVTPRRLIPGRRRNAVLIKA